MTIRISKSRLYLTAALLLWLATITLFGVDLDDEQLGNLGRIALILSIPAATLTVLAWLEGHVTSLMVAFKAGAETAQVKSEAARLARWN